MAVLMRTVLIHCEWAKKLNGETVRMSGDCKPPKDRNPGPWCEVGAASTSPESPAGVRQPRALVAEPQVLTL